MVTAPASPQASSAQSAFASDAPQPSAFSSRSFSLASDEPEARSASNTPSIIIPSEYADWLSFDEQTGLLSGKPPQGLIDQLVFSFIAQQGDDINLSSNGILDIGDKAQTQEFWFDYDAKGQVTVDGGTLSQGVISIAQQGQYFEYDGMGRTTLSISDGGYTAQKMNYSAQGYLLSATHSYNNNKASGQDLFALRQTGNNLGSIHFANQVQHSYDLLGQVTSTLEYFTPGYSKNIDYTSSESGLAGTAKFDLTGIEKSKQEFAYNGDGQMTVSKEYGWAGESLQQELEKFAADKLYGGVTVEVSQFNNADLMPLVRDKLSTEHQLLSTVDNSFDKAGLLDLKIYTQHRKGENSGNSPAQFRHTYDYSYEGRDSYLEKRVVGTGSAQEGSFNPATTTSFYDFSGNRIAVEEKGENSSKYDARYFDYSADGKLLKKQSGTQNKSHAGQIATAPSVPVDGEGNPISDTVVEPSIAHTIGYEETKVPVIEQGKKVGDISTASHYMYAGGQYLGELTEHGQIRVKQQHFKGLDVIKSDSNRVHEVQEGETLRSIAQLQYGNGNFWFIIADANSLTSDPDEGLTVGQSLTIPQQNNNQNSFDTLLPMNLAELIGDTTPSLGYLPPPSEAGCNAVASIIMIAVAVAVTGGVAGAGLLTGSANAAFAAAVGSAASQVAGMALGAVDNFSWKQVAISAITAGATKGLGDKLKLDPAGINAADDIARGAISYGAGHAANKLLGQQTSFSWSNLAASSLGYAAGAQVGTTLAQEIGVDFSTDFGSQLTSELTSGVADLHIGRALGENTKVDYGQIGLDAFGNAIGNTIAGHMQKKPEAKPTTFTDAEKQKIFDEFGFAFGNGGDSNKLITPEELGVILNDEEKASVFDKVLNSGKDKGDIVSIDEAARKAQLVDVRRTVDDINSKLSGLSQSSERFDLLSRASQTLTASLMNVDVYFDQTLSELLPNGVSRLDDSALAALKINLSNSDFRTGDGYFGALYVDTNVTYRTGSDVGAYTFVNRGTDDLSLEGGDIKSNMTQAYGQLAPQYETAVDLARQLNAELKGNIQFSGHSLGGGLASVQALTIGKSAITFNAAGISQETLVRYEVENVDTSNISAYYVDGEILSFLQDGPFAIPTSGFGGRLSTRDLPEAIGNRF